MDIKDVIRLNLKMYREKKGLTQKELADLIGKKHNAISSWESGRNSIDVELLFEICKILGVSINDMYSDDFIKNEILTLSDHEQLLVAAYRANPSMQDAVDRILQIQPEAKKSEGFGELKKEAELMKQELEQANKVQTKEK